MEALVKEIKATDNMESSLPKDKTMISQFVEETKNGKMMPTDLEVKFKFYEDEFFGYTFSFPYTMGLGGGAHKYKAELIDFSINENGRTETFEHFYKKQDGKSNILVTIFNEKQTYNGHTYNIKIYLKTDDFERNFYFLDDF